MDNKDRFIRGAKVAILFICGLCGIMSFTGALRYAHSTGYHIFTVAGIVTLVTLAFAVMSFIDKYLKH